MEKKFYVFSVLKDGKELYYFLDEVEGECLTEDISNAQVFNEKQALEMQKGFNLDKTHDWYWQECLTIVTVNTADIKKILQ